MILTLTVVFILRMIRVYNKYEYSQHVHGLTYIIHERLLKNNLQQTTVAITLR